MTVTARAIANPKPCPVNRVQNKTVDRPPPRAMKVSHFAAVLARSWVLDLLAWASLTSLMTLERKVSSPVLSTRTVRDPSPLIDPPITSPSTVLKIGLDSPVSMDSLSDDSPLIIMPSAGTFSPGLISRCSPPRSVETEISVTVPSPAMRCASSGIRLASFSSARPAPRTDFISIQ